MRGYLPLSEQELSRRFPLRKSGGGFVAREPSDPPRRVGSASVRHIADGVLRHRLRQMDRSEWAGTYGRAEVVRQAYDDGCWITSFYEARNALWHLVRTEHAGRTYPIFIRFTHRSNRIPVTPRPGRNPREDDLSNTLSSDLTHLTQLRWADVRASERPVFRFSAGRRYRDAEDGDCAIEMIWATSTK